MVISFFFESPVRIFLNKQVISSYVTVVLRLDNILYALLIQIKFVKTKITFIINSLYKHFHHDHRISTNIANFTA